MSRFDSLIIGETAVDTNVDYQYEILHNQDYLDGKCSLEEAVYILKRDTRHFAKRQLTWFRREKDVIWLNKDLFSYDNDKILSYMSDRLKEKGILEKQ